MKAFSLSRLVAYSLLLVMCSQAQAFIHESQMVRMRDSVELATEVYKPETFPPPWPVLLTRTPYERTIDSLDALFICDLKGYAMVSQNLRGLRGSQGEPTLFLSDGWGDLQDGYDAIEWIAAQVWSNHLIGMIGASAPGMTQYYAAGSLPPFLVCIAPVAAGPSLYHHSAYPGGEFRKALVETWVNGQGTPWLIDSLANHPNYELGFWGVVDLRTRWDSTSHPMLHVSGWYDLYTDGQLEAFSEMEARHHNQKLFLGPWGHGSWNQRQQGDLTYPPNAQLADDFLFTGLLFPWYDYWLKGSGSTGVKVCFYLMGDCDGPDTTRWNRWVTADTWPLPEMRYASCYLRENGGLDTLPPALPEKADTFRYDPQDPCPTIGGREYIGIPNGYGPKDQRPIEGRADVLVYSTPVLAAPLKVAGKMILILYASSDRRDTDWAVRVTDVYPDGRSILMTDNILMARHRKGLDREDLLFPGVPDTFAIDLWSTANVWNAGHRLRVSITSSNYPRFERNPNTGDPFRRNDTLNALVATNAVYHTPSLASRLLLPVVPMGPGGAEEKAEGGPMVVSRVTAVPNPFTGFAVAPGHERERFHLYDVAGRRVGTYKGDRIGGGLAAGVYFLRPSAGNAKPLRIVKVR